MDGPPFFSVIIPTFNRPDLLCRAVKSVLNQSYVSFEIIVIDDGSNSPSGKLLPFVDERITIFRNEQCQGAAAARNSGIRAAKGKWIVFLDDDDEFRQDFLFNLCWRLRRADSTIGFSWSSVCHFLYGSDGNPVAYQFTYFDATYEAEGEIYAQALRIGCGYGLTIKKECIDKVGYFDTSFRVGEDTDIIFRLMSYGYRPLVCADVGVIVHEHRRSRLTPNFLEHAKTGVYVRLIEKYRDFIPRYVELLSRFMGWAATVHFMARDDKQGNKILIDMLKMNPVSYLIWKKYFQILGRKLLIKCAALKRVR